MFRRALIDTVSHRLARRPLYSSARCLQAASGLETKAKAKTTCTTAATKPRQRKKKAEEEEEDVDSEHDWARDPNLVKELLPEHPLLADTRATGSTANNESLTLDEFERFRPPLGAIRRMTMAKDSYEEQYVALVSKLAKAFKKQQLLHALDLYGIEYSPGVGRNSKEQIASLILAQWGLKPISEFYAEIIERHIPMRPGEAFVVLNETMSLARQHKVSMSFSLESAKLSLKAFNTAKIEKVMKVVEELRLEHIAHKTASIPLQTHLPESELQSICFASGSFVERLPDSRYRITYNQARHDRPELALQLLTRAAYEHSEERPEDPSSIFKLSEDAHASYSLQPFASPQSLFSSKPTLSTFRLARNEPTSSSESNMLGLAKSLEGTLSALRPTLFNGPASNVIVDATLGHCTFETGLLNPLSIEGSFKAQDGAESIQNDFPSKSSFTAFVPHGLYHLPFSSNQTYQRFIYSGLRSLSLPYPDATPTLRLFVTLDASENSLLRRQHPHLSDDVYVAKQVGTAPQFLGLCDEGWKRAVDILLPDGSVDMRLRISHMSSITPIQALQTYVDQLVASSQDAAEGQSTTPVPPNAVWHQGQLFVLTSSEVVRAGMKEATPSDRIFTEIVQDTQFGDSQTSCYVSCVTDDTEENWSRFVERSTWLAEFALQDTAKPVTDFGDSLLA